MTQALDQASERVARADQEELRGFIAVYNSDSDERLQAWMKRAVKLGSLTQVLNSLRTNLHRYANATDRSIITHVWAEQRAEFLETLNSDRADARLRFYDYVEHCLAGTLGDEEDKTLFEDGVLTADDLGVGPIAPKPGISVQASANVFPLSSQACNQVFDYTGTITVDGPVTVKYRWGSDRFSRKLFDGNPHLYRSGD